MTNSVSSVTSRLNSIYPIVLVYFYAREGGGKKIIQYNCLFFKKKNDSFIFYYMYHKYCLYMLFHKNVSLVTLELLFQLPEMMSVDSRDGENPFFHLVFQACGMFLGIGIMLIIAMYEDKMKTMMEP